MTFSEMSEKCKTFFEELTHILAETHEIIGSCNQDTSCYLIPKGTSDEITYHSKPQNSYRISDHWNWYANIKKCPNERYIQCLSLDLPYAKPRKYSGGPSNPIKANAVCAIDSKGIYRVIYGEKYDKKSKQWIWVETDPREYAKSVLALQL